MSQWALRIHLALPQVLGKHMFNTTSSLFVGAGDQAQVLTLTHSMHSTHWVRFLAPVYPESLKMFEFYESMMNFVNHFSKSVTIPKWKHIALYSNVFIFLFLTVDNLYLLRGSKCYISCWLCLHVMWAWLTELGCCDTIWLQRLAVLESWEIQYGPESHQHIRNASSFLYLEFGHTKEFSGLWLETSLSFCLNLPLNNNPYLRL